MYISSNLGAILRQFKTDFCMANCDDFSCDLSEEESRARDLALIEILRNPSGVIEFWHLVPLAPCFLAPWCAALWRPGPLLSCASAPGTLLLMISLLALFPLSSCLLPPCVFVFPSPWCPVSLFVSLPVSLTFWHTAPWHFGHLVP